jgi:hypothetical protein
LKRHTPSRALLLLAIGGLLSAGIQRASAQTDSIPAAAAAAAASAVIGEEQAAAFPPLSADTTAKLKIKQRDWSTWRPDPQRALWLALVLPGAGQVYNRKYWKLPIFYGGMMGCIYAMSWNNMMYKSYSQAYLDIMDSDPGTASYNKFMHLGKQIDSSNEERYKQIFKSRKDKYRRWRDLSFFCLIGVYALSVIDAYVDAELSEFDIAKDLSLKVEPAVINNGLSNNAFESSALGVHCSLNF